MEEETSVKCLPEINWKGRKFTFDYRLNELRQIVDDNKINFICLNNQETELLAFAIRTGDRRLINNNMEDLSWKFRESRSKSCGSD